MFRCTEVSKIFRSSSATRVVPCKILCLEDAYQAWVYSENDCYGCSHKAVSPPDGLFAEQEPYPDLFCFLREGKGIFKPGFWILGQAFYNMKDLLRADLRGMMCEVSLILHCGAETSLLNLCLLLLLHDLPDLRQFCLQENALWVSNIDMFSHSAS